MTDEEKCLFDASLRTDDRVSPLVYSDWLTERDREREAAYWRKVVEYRTRFASAPSDYHCSMWMLTCGELSNSFAEMKRMGCPQCQRWASLNVAEESDRWLCGMRDKLGGRKVL